MYQWWVFVHLAGVFGLLVSHGVSVALSFQLRIERDPARVQSLLQLSGNSIRAFYSSLGVLLIGGIAATTDGGLWGYGWIWASLLTLTIVVVAMYILARPYYHRIRYVATAMAAGSGAVTPQQFDELLRSRRSLVIIWIGFVGLAILLYLMLFKPTLGIAPEPTRAANIRFAPRVTVVANETSFLVDLLTADAGETFVLELDNRSSVPHNISIYEGEDAVIVGDVFSGPQKAAYEVPPLERGSYVFKCDVHPVQMTGILEVR